MQKILDEWQEAKRRGDLMQKDIEDDLIECDYNAEARKTIFDQALYGAGVMKGPVPFKRVRKAWSQDENGEWTLEVIEELKPSSFRVDPRNIFPDPLCGENVQNGRGLFELDKKNSKQVRDLMKQPGYIKTALEKVLEEGPQIGKAQVTNGELEDRDYVPGNVWEHWIYWGEIDADTLEASGLDMSKEQFRDGISACVEMINSTIVRAYLNPTPNDELPYDIVPLEVIPGSVWGFGVPYLMRSQQRVINAAWRMILDNAGVSSGPQVVIKKNLIQPADKTWTITARKIWFADESVEDVNKAMAMFEFPSRQAELQALIEMADKLADIETAVPMQATGSQPSAETLGGMQILQQGQNVMLKRQVRIIDDRMTKPHMRRYYHFKMEYSPNPDIKGDFDVNALGSSALVIRDIQNQAMTNLLSLATNPAYAPLINLKKLFARALKAQHLDPNEVMNSDAEIAQAQQAAAQQQQPDPRVVAAQARAKADMERTQAQVQMNDATLENKRAMVDADNQHKWDVAQLDFHTELLRLANKKDLSLDQIKAQLAGVAIKERSKQDMQVTDLKSANAQAEASPMEQ
jgi:hypothetical protein